MDKLAKLKMKNQMVQIKKSTESCIEFLNGLQEIVISLDDPEAKTSMNTVIQHQKNMVKFFGVMEQNLQN